MPCLLSEPGETNPYNFQHFSRGQPSITHPNMGSDCVGHDKEHKRSCAGTRNQDLSPQTELQRIRLSNRGLGDISEGLILRARAQGGGLLPAGRPRLCQHPIMGRAKMGLLQDPVVSSWGGVGEGWGVRDLRGNRSDGQIRGPVQCDPAGPGRPDKCTPCPCCPSTKSKRGESLFPWLLWYRDPVHQNKLTQGPRTCMGR